MSKETALAAANLTPAPAAPNDPIGVPATPETPAQLPSTPFSQLAKKEADLVRQRQEFKKERELFQSEQKKVQEIQAKVKEYEDLKVKDPVAALKFIGFSETDIFNYLANQEKKELTAEEKAAQAAKDAADSTIKTWEQAQAEKEAKARETRDNALIDGYKKELSKAIESNRDKFEYCSYYGDEAQELAYEITLAVVKESEGKDVISAEEAVQMAEDYFEAKDGEMMNLKKRQSKLKPSEPVAPQASPAQPERSRTVTPARLDPDLPKPPQTVSRVRSLSNNATATVASTRLQRMETREQKRERLIQALRNGGKP